MNNKENSNKIITVVYNETITTDLNKIGELKSSFKQGKNYEIMLDYDVNGFVNKVTIKDIQIQESAETVTKNSELEK